MKKLVSVLLALILIASLSSMAMAESATIKIGATPTPHAEILELIKDDLAAKGFQLEITVLTDYNTGNPAVAAGDLDANYFQHHPFLDSYNEAAADAEKLVSAFDVHYEPFAIYPGKTKTLEELKDGAQVSVTNDPSNEARALLLLQDAGLIKLREGAGLAATILDIEENPKNLEIIEMDAAQLPRTLADVDLAVINGNFALDAGLNPVNDSVFMEQAGSDAALVYANVVAIRPADAEADWVKALKEVMCSEKVYNYMIENEAYAGGVVPAFTIE